MSSRQPAPGRLERLYPALAAASALAVFLPSLGGALLHWDDLGLLGAAGYRSLSWAALKWMFTTFTMSNYTPLSWLSYAVDFRLWGAAAPGYHLTNVLLHAANAALFCVVARRLLAAAGRPAREAHAGALCAALLFALHPLRVESVAWVAERRDVLCGLFVLTAAWLYLRRLERGAEGRRMPEVWLAHALALLSKPIATTLPLGLLVLDWFPLRRLSRAAVLEKLPLFALSAAAAVLGALAQGAAVVPWSRYGGRERLAQAAYDLAFYVAKTLAPAGLSPLYERSALLDPAPFALSAAGIVAVCVATWRWRARHPELLAAWLWYAALLLPTLGFVKVGFAIAADRYSYLPCLSLALLGGALLARRPVVAVCLAAGLGALTARQCLVWRDDASLWTRVVEVNPRSFVGWDNLSRAAAAAGDAPGAARLHERSRRERAEVCGRIAEILARRGETELARELYARARLP